MTLEGLQYG
jgi:exocyst complex component 5